MHDTQILSALDLRVMPGYRTGHTVETKRNIFQHIMKYIPEEKYSEVINADATAQQNICIVFNPFGGIHQKYHLSVTSAFISTLKKISPEDWNPRMEYVLHFAFLTLLCKPKASLLDLKSLLINANMRTEALSHVSDQQVFDFWYRDFNSYPPQHQTEIINKIVAKITPCIYALQVKETDQPSSPITIA